ncbi:hypothetical protein [Streptomyces justiciae]|uniref:hypothetical protein n=1 Tax=Streptomyces justiciae TaxID=2780140 RepID=UPI00187E63F0|nr:hypothetical protein [Streptomyces justiciae]MBE8474435.1 hypothetical protein [Streptomyces justiciae]
MRLITSPAALLLGLHHVRVWKLTSDQPLLRADDGLSAEAAAGAWEQDAPELPAGYRTLLADLGYEGTTPAGERLREGVRSRGWRSHGAVVDAVSVATLRHGAGIGLHSLFKEDEGSDLVVTRAAGTERIVPAFSTKSKPVPAGDLLYGLADPDGAVEEPFAWLGRRDCDAASRQLAPDSREALLVVLGCPGEDAAHSEAIGATVASLLAELRPDVTLTPVV